jgi:tetratricopeptide (TPR) repeat protein
MKYKVQKILRRIMNQDSDDADSYIKKIDELLNNGNFAKAIKLSEEASKQDIGNYDKSRLYHRIGIAYGYMNEYGKAIDYFEEAVKLLSDLPESENVLFQKASLYFHLGKSFRDYKINEEYFDKAILYFENIINNYPKTKYNCDILLSIAEIKEKLNYLDESKHYFKLAFNSCETDFEKAHSLLRIGDIEYKLRNFKEAEKIYSDASNFKEKQNQVAVLFGLANAQYELGKLDDAENNFNYVLKLKKNDPYLKSDTLFDVQRNYWLGIINYQNNKYPIALYYFENAKKNIDKYHQDYNEILIYLGHCYLGFKGFLKSKKFL